MKILPRVRPIGPFRTCPWVDSNPKLGIVVEELDVERRLPLFLDLLIVAGLFVAGLQFLPGASTYKEKALVLDECGWLAVSDDTYHLYSQAKDVQPSDWKEGLQKTSYGRINPNFGKLLFGFLLKLQDYDLEPPPVFPLLNEEAKRKFRNLRWVENQAEAHEPFVRSMRGVNQILMVAGAVCLYVLGSVLAGRILGLLVWACFTFTPLVHFLSPRFATDSLLLFMSVGTVLVLGYFLDRWTRRREELLIRILGIGAMGILLGLTTATKLNGAVMCLAFGITAVGLWIGGRLQARRKFVPAIWIAGVAFLSVGTFLQLNPVFWEDVFGEAQWVVDRWDRVIQEQIDRQPELGLTGLGARFSAVWSESVVNIGPAGGFWRVVLPILAVLGLGLLAWRAWQVLRGQRQSAWAWVVLVWVLAWMVSTVLWIPYSRERYFLPVIGPACFLAMLPVSEFLYWSVGRLRVRFAAD